MAEVGADLGFPRGGERERRRRLLPAARLRHAQLEVLLQLREGYGGLERCVEQRGAVLLLRRDALELVLAAALLPTHALVAIGAAERQPLAASFLEARL